MQYSEIKKNLRAHPKRWLVTGCAGFIGSNLVEQLLLLGQKVVGLDNFSTGFKKNLDEIRLGVSGDQWSNFTFIEGDICSMDTCIVAINRLGGSVDFVLHQAALGSVPRSIDDPMATHESNVTGHLNMLLASKKSGVKSFVYAASSSTYGDHPGLPKVEEITGNPLSPYAVTKLVNELYSQVFDRVYGFKAIGLRYFNVFGKRQNPRGAYAAVIPAWVGAMLTGSQLYINGNGDTSRDFCFIDNVIQANILAATAPSHAQGHVYNVAVNAATSLNELYTLLKAELSELGVDYYLKPEYREFRAGDVMHSMADIGKAMNFLGYSPTHTVGQGIKSAMPWYVGYFNDSKK